MKLRIQLSRGRPDTPRVAAQLGLGNNNNAIDILLRSRARSNRQSQGHGLPRRAHSAASACSAQFVDES
eukprot:3013838-Pyramimonas_sp.AAC.1